MSSEFEIELLCGLLDQMRHDTHREFSHSFEMPSSEAVTFQENIWCGLDSTVALDERSESVLFEDGEMLTFVWSHSTSRLQTPRSAAVTTEENFVTPRSAPVPVANHEDTEECMCATEAWQGFSMSRRAAVWEQFTRQTMEHSFDEQLAEAISPGSCDDRKRYQQELDRVLQCIEAYQLQAQIKQMKQSIEAAEYAQFGDVAMNSLHTAAAELASRHDRVSFDPDSDLVCQLRVEYEKEEETAPEDPFYAALHRVIQAWTSAAFQKSTPNMDHTGFSQKICCVSMNIRALAKVLLCFLPEHITFQALYYVLVHLMPAQLEWERAYALNQVFVFVTNKRMNDRDLLRFGKQ